MSDIVIKGGTVVDGTGAPGRIADVAVTDGVISEIGTGLTGDRVLDVQWQTAHLASLGVVERSRDAYLADLPVALHLPLPAAFDGPDLE